MTPIATNQQEQKGVEMKRSMKNDEPQKQKRKMLKRKVQYISIKVDRFLFAKNKQQSTTERCQMKRSMKNDEAEVEDAEKQSTMQVCIMF